MAKKELEKKKTESPAVAAEDEDLFDEEDIFGEPTPAPVVFVEPEEKPVAVNQVPGKLRKFLNQ